VRNGEGFGDDAYDAALEVRGIGSWGMGRKSKVNEKSLEKNST
jgi:hypothetical protein